MGAMESAGALIEVGQDKVLERLEQCKEFGKKLEIAKSQLCSGQFELIQRSNAAPK
jgi:hypothetical protein